MTHSGRHNGIDGSCGWGRSWLFRLIAGGGPLVRESVLAPWLSCLLAVGALAAVGQAAVLHVPAEYLTIQAALDAAANTGDEIIVAPGTYPEAINFVGKAVYLHSADGPAVTIIDATGLYTSVVTCASGEGPGSILEGFTMTGGSAWNGGGMHNSGSSPTVTRCTFSGNWAFAGGGMCNESSSPTVTDCMFVGNIARSGLLNPPPGYGGGMCNWSSSPTVTNCTFRGNVAWGWHWEWEGERGHGNGIFGGGGVTNCLLWNNGGGWEIEGGASVTYSDVQGGYAGTGNIDADPMFIDPNNGNFRLSHGSPSIDAGNNAAVPAGLTTDLDGNPRFVDVPCRPDTGHGSAPIVDMGAYEAPDTFIDCNRNGIDDLCDMVNGTSLDCNTNGVPDECDIANGTSQDCNGNGIPDECEVDCNHNGVPDDCDIANGTSQDCNHNGIPDECDIANGTSQDCNGNGVPDECDLANGTLHDVFPPGGDGIPDECEGRVHNVTQNSYFGFIQPALDAAAAGDEVVVGPWTYPEAINFHGKAAYLRSSDGPAVTIIDAQGNGSVVTCASGEGPGTVLEGFTITGGSGTWCGTLCGAGMYNSGSSPTVTNCTFIGNSAVSEVEKTSAAGGGMFNWGSSPTVTNCSFIANSASADWGGWGGGMYNSDSSPTVTNCTFNGNWADSGGGICGGALVSNCILRNDWLDEVAGSATVTYSDVQGGYTGIGNIDADPLFVDPDNGNFRLQAGSRCIDAADPNFVPAPGATDLDGRKRLWDGDANGVAVVDMGAYEFGSYCYGDLDCNGNCDFGDINPFVLALSNPAGYRTAFPDCDIYLGDLNADGHVDFGDINPFVALLSGP